MLLNSLILLSALVSKEPNRYWFQPYFGYSVSVNTEEVNTVNEIDHRGNFFKVGLPFSVSHFSFILGEPLFLIVPEFTFWNDHYMGSLSFGPEWDLRQGYRQIPSTFVVGWTVGGLYGYRTNDNPQLRGSSALYEGDRSNYGLDTHVYMGPGFSFSDYWEIRTLAVVEAVYGHISGMGFRSAFANNLGLKAGFVIQVKFGIEGQRIVTPTSTPIPTPVPNPDPIPIPNPSDG